MSNPQTEIKEEQIEDSDSSSYIEIEKMDKRESERRERVKKLLMKQNSNNRNFKKKKTI